MSDRGMSRVLRNVPSDDKGDTTDGSEALGMYILRTILMTMLTPVFSEHWVPLSGLDRP